MGVVFKDKYVAIRKPRQCFGCFRMFYPGVIMNYSTGINDDNDFYAIYLCQTCEELGTKLLEYDDCIEEGFVIEAIEAYNAIEAQNIDFPEELLSYLQQHNHESTREENH